MPLAPVASKTFRSYRGWSLDGMVGPIIAVEQRQVQCRVEVTPLRQRAPIGGRDLPARCFDLCVVLLGDSDGLNSFTSPRSFK